MLSKDGMLNARHVHKLAILCTHSNIKFNYCAVAFTLWIWILVRTLEARKNFLRIIWTYKMRQQFFPWSIDPGGECIRSGFEIIQVLLVCWLALVLHYCNKSIRGQIFYRSNKSLPMSATCCLIDSTCCNLIWPLLTRLLYQTLLHMSMLR